MWYGIIDRATGRLVSTGTALVDATEGRSEAEARNDLAERGLDVVELGDEFSQEGHAWDEQRRQFVPVIAAEKPARELALDDMLAQIDDVRRKLIAAMG